MEVNTNVTDGFDVLTLQIERLAFPRSCVLILFCGDATFL